MSHIERKNLSVSGSESDHVLVSDNDGITIIITQAFGPDGDNIVGIRDVSFDGYPAVTLRVKAAGQDGEVHLSPFHGDRRKETTLQIPPGTTCELLCPVSGKPMPRVEGIQPEGSAEYFAIYLSSALSQGDTVAVSNLWDHYHSRVLDNFELLSLWASEDR
jgi:hypothetical protein